MSLRGVIYGGGFHFTAKFISTSGNVWFHDGMTTRESCVEEGSLDQMEISSLQTASGKSAVMLIYAQSA